MSVDRIYFKVLRSSNTGKKFVEVERKILKIIKLRNELSKEYGFLNFFGTSDEKWFGKPVYVHFRSEPDLSIWRKVKKGYSPREDSEIGQEILKKFETVPQIDFPQINFFINRIDSNKFKIIGFNYRSKHYYGFITSYIYGAKMPLDCIEIDSDTYIKLGIVSEQKLVDKR